MDQLLHVGSVGGEWLKLIDMRDARGNNLLRIYIYCIGPRQRASACRPQIRFTNHRWLRQRHACASILNRAEA